MVWHVYCLPTCVSRVKDAHDYFFTCSQEIPGSGRRTSLSQRYWISSCISGDNLRKGQGLFSDLSESSYFWRNVIQSRQPTSSIPDQCFILHKEHLFLSIFWSAKTSRHTDRLQTSQLKNFILLKKLFWEWVDQLEITN